MAWALCLVGVTTDRPWIGPLLVFFLAIFHFMRVSWKRGELLLSLVMTVGGTVIDTLLLNSGVIKYHGGYSHFPWLAPLWVSSVWLLFSLTVTTSFDWLRQSLWLSMPLGAAGGVLSYMAAVRMGAAMFPQPLIAICLLAALWSFLMPLILWFSENQSQK